MKPSSSPQGLPLFRLLKLLLCSCVFLCALPSRAGLLDDDEARKAILDLRTEVRKRDSDQSQNAQVLSDQLNRLGAVMSDHAQRLKVQQEDYARQIEQLRRNLLDLNNALTLSKEDNARLRGQVEVLQNAQAQWQNQLQNQQQVQLKKQADLETALDTRLKKLEPRTVAVDGKEAVVERAEESSFNAALNQFKAADYKAASRAFETFVAQYPQSGLQATAQFWLGNSQFANKDSKAALATLQTMMQKFPQHPRAADAYLTMGHCYEDMNDKKRSAELYDYVIKAFPDTPQSDAAKEALPKKPALKKKA